MMLLAGDIGGTKTLLGLYPSRADARNPLALSEFRSADFAGLEEMVRVFLEQTGRTASHGCFDVPGPVIGGRARLTNLPWSLAEEPLSAALGLQRVALINDLKAIAHAVPYLQESELHTINSCRPDPQGNIAVIAPGTGLGEAFVVRNGPGYIACSSEGGHTDFGPADETQADLLRYMADRFGHVSYERVCSGIGIPNIYDFLRDTGHAPEPPGFAATLASAPDPTPLIVETARKDPAANPLCAATLRIFTDILAAEAGNLALKVLATGGVYLAGGIPGRILPSLTGESFLKAFVRKGRFADFLKDVPVHVVMTRAALLGAALYGFDHLEAPLE
ncbi:MAG: glucokinase [Syntrophobacteraceae bacterium]